ncbi:MAG: hypothetical protein LBD35_03185 [Prevotellaceae bacterium]|jgi:hypothetical protein|nr:hypothetical protein [Prevotellaceae bacterium]
MKKYLNFIAILVFTVLLGCKSTSQDQEEVTEDKLSVDKTELNFTAGVTSQIFSINSKGEWNIEAAGLAISANVGTTSWCSVEPVFGNTGTKITVTLLENVPTTQAAVTLKVIGKNNQVAVTINKPAAN